MKIVSEEELQGHTSATIRGATEGFVGSVALAVPGFYYLSRRWAYYRALPLPLKVLPVVMVIAPCISIQAERRGLAYDRAQWTGAGKMELDKEAAEAEARWIALSTKEKIKSWAIQHQYSIILGSWALSIAAAGGIIARDKHQSLPQKVVQARMWAQGLTIGVLIAAGALTHTKRQDAVRHLPVDHSWQSLLEQQAIEEEEKKTRLNALRQSTQAVVTPTA